MRANLPDELAPVWDAVKRKIAANPRRSRTESFLEWAAENAGDVYAIQNAQLERDVAELIEREAELREQTRSPAHYRELSDAELYRRYESSGASSKIRAERITDGVYILAKWLRTRDGTAVNVYAHQASGFSSRIPRDAKPGTWYLTVELVNSLSALPLATLGPFRTLKAARDAAPGFIASAGLTAESASGVSAEVPF